jgi:hypothetical protein
MYQLTQLASDMYRERLEHAEQQRPAQRCSRCTVPPAAPSAPSGGCAAPSARSGGCAPSPEPRPRRPLYPATAPGQIGFET